MSLSEGGFSVEAPLRVDQGDPLRVRILPHRKGRALEVEGIAWGDQPVRRARERAGGLRLLVCVLSDPPSEFLELLQGLLPRYTAPAERPVRALPRPHSEPEEPNLPRSFEPLPPPKPKPVEELPFFRIRLKQTGGPRTRIVSIRARSTADAEALALEQCSGPWKLLDVALT